MAKFTKEEFISGLKEMNLLEINELVEAMKEEFGVDPSAAMVAAAPAQGEAENDAPSTYTINLVECGSNKLAVIKLIREITGLGLKEAKAIADAGGEVKADVPAKDAEDYKAKFEEAGAKVELK